MAKLRYSQVKGKKKAKRQLKVSLKTIRTLSLGSLVLGLVILAVVPTLVNANPEAPWWAMVPSITIGSYMVVVSFGAFKLNRRCLVWYYPIAFLWGCVSIGFLPAYIEAVSGLKSSTTRLSKLADQEHGRSTRGGDT